MAIIFQSQHNLYFISKWKLREIKLFALMYTAAQPEPKFCNFFCNKSNVLFITFWKCLVLTSNDNYSVFSSKRKCFKGFLQFLID